MANLIGKFTIIVKVIIDFAVFIRHVSKKIIVLRKFRIKIVQARKSFSTQLRQVTMCKYVKKPQIH
jgi:hypothetical protein